MSAPFFRNYIAIPMIIGSSAVLAFQVDAQPIRGASVAKAAIMGALDQAPTGNVRRGPVFIDASSFSRLLRAATGEDVDIESVAAAAGTRAVPSRSGKVTCDYSVGLCQVAEDGLLITIDSLSLTSTGGEALVTYEFNTRRGSNREFIHLAFVQVRLVLQRDGDNWRVTRREITMRS